MRRWYEIKAKGERAEVWLYDEIGMWGIGAKEFIVELNAVKQSEMDLHINSPGGEVFDGAAIYNAIKRHPAAVTTYIDGLAASIASVIALAGEKVIIAENGLYMMHNPFGLVLGNADDMRKQADVLDKVRDTMIGAYTSKSGQSDEEIKALLDAETWMNADEAIAAGFADEMSEEMDMAACAKFGPAMAKLGFQRVPRVLVDGKEDPTQKEVERALRGAGFSAKFAKTIIAAGYPEHPRDAGPTETPVVDAPPRDAVQPKPTKMDKVADLLCRAEVAAPVA